MKERKTFPANGVRSPTEKNENISRVPK